MVQKKSQQQCSSTKREYRNVEIENKGKKKVYEISICNGGKLSLVTKIKTICLHKKDLHYCVLNTIIKAPLSKKTTKIKRMFYKESDFNIQKQDYLNKKDEPIRDI